MHSLFIPGSISIPDTLTDEVNFLLVGPNNVNAGGTSGEWNTIAIMRE